jgi:hypothetical protein
MYLKHEHTHSLWFYNNRTIVYLNGRKRLRVELNWQLQPFIMFILLRIVNFKSFSVFFLLSQKDLFKWSCSYIMYASDTIRKVIIKKMLKSRWCRNFCNNKDLIWKQFLRIKRVNSWATSWKNWCMRYIYFESKQMSKIRIDAWKHILNLIFIKVLMTRTFVSIFLE